MPGVGGLWVLATGERPADPTGVLSSPRLTEVLGDLRQRFDVVLVDSPPVLPVTDAVILARVVDATLLVVAAGHDSGTRTFAGPSRHSLSSRPPWSGWY